MERRVGEVRPGREYMVARLDVVHGGSDGVDDAGRLIAGRTRVVRRVVLGERAVPAGECPAFGSLADSREGCPDPDFVRTRFGDLQVPDLDSPRFGEHNCRRLHRRRPLRSGLPALGTISSGAAVIIRSPISGWGRALRAQGPPG